MVSAVTIYSMEGAAGLGGRLLFGPDRFPPSADGFLWEIRSNAHERMYRARDGRMARPTATPEPTATAEPSGTAP